MTTIAPVVDGKFLTYSQAAEKLQVSHRYMRKLCASRQIKAKKLGRIVRIDPAELDRFCRALPVR